MTPDFICGGMGGIATNRSSVEPETSWIMLSAGSAKCRAGHFSYGCISMMRTTRTTRPRRIKSAMPQPYDAEIAYAEACLGKLFDVLQKHGRYEETRIAVIGGD